jgi:hypothetical protein
LVAELPTDRPKLSVVDDYGLSELSSGPDATPVAIEPKTASVSVKKPDPSEYIFIHPEWCLNVYLLRPDRSRSEYSYKYLVIALVAEKVLKLCRNVQLVPFACKNRTFGLWPIPLKNALGDISPYDESALGCVAYGAGKWNRYEGDTVRYHFYACPEPDPDPAWPEGGLKHLVNTAFRGRIITDPNSEVLRKRVGQLVR